MIRGRNIFQPGLMGWKMLELKNSRAEPMLKWPSPYTDSFMHMQMRDKSSRKVPLTNQKILRSQGKKK